MAGSQGTGVQANPGDMGAFPLQMVGMEANHGTPKQLLVESLLPDAAGLSAQFSNQATVKGYLPTLSSCRAGLTLCKSALLIW